MQPMSETPPAPLAKTLAHPLATARQLVQVVAPDWASRHGRLQRFARPDNAGRWQVVASPVPVSLGRAGLAWGIGRHGAGLSDAPVKREGDGCSPAGAFAITALFGKAALRPDTAHLPFVSVSPDLKAIDDPASRHYNRIVDQREIADIDWHSHEEMLRDDSRYDLGAVVGHNSDLVVAGAGSCIFLHVWESEGAPTAGCTAMALANLRDLANWLDAETNPVLVQLPMHEYVTRQADWQLPPCGDSEPPAG